MPVPKSDYIWFDGRFVPFEDAKVHVLSHVLHYGSSIFEGVRCYETAQGPAIFCLTQHVKRLYNSAKVYRMDIPYTPAQFAQAMKDTVARNGFLSCYIRPLVFRGYGQLGVEPRTCPISAIIAVWEWGAYLGAEAMEQGVDVGVSSWRRMAPDTFPAAIKAGGHYTNSQLIRMEAADLGYSEGIALDVNGYVSEGSGENIFLVQDGALITPPLSASILGGITRQCVMALARDLGIEVREAMVSREQLYVADELFFTGTAAEITPIRSVDHIVVGPGHCGPVTASLQKAFFDIIAGRAPDRRCWLSPISA